MAELLPALPPRWDGSLELPEFLSSAADWAQGLDLAEASDGEARAAALAKLLSQQEGEETKAREHHYLALVLARRVGDLLLELEGAECARGGRGKTFPAGEGFSVSSTERGRLRDLARVPGDQFAAELERCPLLSKRKLASLGRRHRPDYQPKEPPGPLNQVLAAVNRALRVAGDVGQLGHEGPLDQVWELLEQAQAVLELATRPDEIRAKARGGR